MNTEGAGFRQDRTWWSANQRIVVLTFGSAEEAEAWDEAGQPLDLIRGQRSSDVAELHVHYEVAP